MLWPTRFKSLRGDGGGGGVVWSKFGEDRIKTLSKGVKKNLNGI